MNRVISKVSKILVGVFSFACVFVLLSLNARAEGTATVAVEGAYIRSNASTSGTVVSSATRNAVLDVLGSEVDSAGYTWYKVSVDDNTTGYIRGDLVTTSGVSGAAPVDTTPATEVVLENPELIEVVPVGGNVTGEVRVRSGASTSHSVVTVAKANTVVTVSGYSTASDGNVWYKIAYDDVEGFIRNDYVKLDGELTEPAPEPEPEPEPEASAQEPEEEYVYKDYEAVYSADEDCWYLNNYNEGTRAKVTDLYEAAKNLSDKERDFNSQIKKKNIIIGVLAAVIIILIGLGVYAYISIRRWYYGDDSETEEPVNVKPQTSSKSSVKGYTVGSQKSFGRADNREENISASEYFNPTGSQGGYAKQERTVTPKTTVSPAQSSQTARPASTASANSVASRLGGTPLPDGRIQMPDGSIRRGIVAVKMADGSIKYPDGTIKRPDGTIVKPASDEMAPAPAPAPAAPYSAPSAAPAPSYDTNPAPTYRQGTSSHSVREVPLARTSETASDDDMEFGFLDVDSDNN